MGHIVKKEIEIVEKELCCAKSPSRVRFESSPTSPPPSHFAGPSYHPNKVLKSSSTSWQDCVQGIASLLPLPYGEHWLRSLDHLLHGDGPLPECWRIYIAIMGLCRHEVTWVVRALTLEFLAAEGDRRWLCGLKYAPGKLRALSQINNLLAHRPWLLTSQHIQGLIKGDESWSLGELCQAICLLTHFHALASFMHSCLPFLHNCSPPQPSSPSHRHSGRNSPSKTNPSTLSNASNFTLDSAASQLDVASHNSEDIAKAPCTSPCKNGSPSTSSSVSPSKGSQLVSSAIVLNGTSTPPQSASVPIPQSSAETAEVKGTNSIIKSLGSTPSGSKREIQASPQPSKQSKSESHPTPSDSSEGVISSPVREYAHLCIDLAFSYENFSPNPKSAISLFKVREFNWLDNGYCLMSRILTEFGKLLDDRFRSIRTLTHPSWESEDRCSLQIRTAVWNFIQSLFGIHHDDYNYDLLKRFLDEDVQGFIKRSSCWPETLEGKVPTSLTKGQNHVPSEVIPLSIVIMEGRLQSELLYALRAIVPNHC